MGSTVKRLIRKTIDWYIGFIVHQIVKFAWAVSRMFHVVVDHIEDLEAAVETQRTPELPDSAVPATDPGSSWWSADGGGGAGRRHGPGAARRVRQRDAGRRC